MCTKCVTLRATFTRNSSINVRVAISHARTASLVMIPTFSTAKIMNMTAKQINALSRMNNQTLGFTCWLGRLQLWSWVSLWFWDIGTKDRKFQSSLLEAEGNSMPNDEPRNWTWLDKRLKLATIQWLLKQPKYQGYVAPLLMPKNLTLKWSLSVFCLPKPWLGQIDSHKWFLPSESEQFEIMILNMVI